MLYSFVEDCMFGMINNKGEIIVKPNYSILSDKLYEGYALGHRNALWTYIDRFGIEVQHFTFQTDVFKEGRAPIFINGYKGFVNKKFEIAVKPKYYDTFSTFHEGLASVATPDEEKRKFGFINRNGKEVIPLQYEFVRDFREGLAVVVVNDNKEGVINQFGEMIIEPKYELLNDCHEGKIPFYVNEKWGVMDNEGKILVEPKFPDKIDWFYLEHNYSEGFIHIFNNDEKLSYADVNGEEMTDYIFDDACAFSNGFARVNKDGKWAFMNRDFEFITGFYFDSARDFIEGLAAVEINHKWGYINTAGEVIINPQYDSALDFDNGLANTTFNEHDGFINTEGKEIFRANRPRGDINI